MNKLQNWLAAGLIGFASQSANAIILDIDYSYDSNNFFNGHQIRQDILEAAADFYEYRISDSLLAISSFGSNQFTARFDRPDTGTLIELNGFDVAADTLKIFVGGMNLGGSTLGIGGAGGYGISFTSSTFVDNVVSRGQGSGTRSAVEGGSAVDYATWGGAITFNIESDWYFDDNVNTDEAFSGSDFFSVALHEIGHLLGFGIVDSWNNQIVAGAFEGVNAVAIFGAPVPVTNDAGHWVDGTTSGGQEAAFDPIITNGMRKRLTDLDLAALKDIGWEVHPVPVPGGVWLFGSALIGLIAVSRRQRV